jgi:porin
VSSGQAIPPRIVAALLLTSALAAAEEPVARPAPGDVILIDRFGHVVAVPPDKVPRGLLPPDEVGIAGQVPRPAVGAHLPRELLDRMDSGRQRTFTLFPASPPKLESYLSAQDELGNTVLQPGALVDIVPSESVIQAAKYWLGARGLRYSLSQDFTYTGVPDTPTGSPNMGYYTLKLEAKWSVYDSPDSGTAGGLSTEIEAKEGLGGAGVNQSAKGNIGSLTNPTGSFSRRNDFRIPELAWQESFARGRGVVMAGVVDQSNYIDVNTYANTGRGQFMNSALINSMVLPLPAYNFAVNLQWQPTHYWYAMVGATAGSAVAGQTPWTDFNWQNWSVVSEIGFAPDDFFGMGPGVYRIQPFLAQAGGPTQGGAAFNFQQQLGHKSPLGWFGRFGVGGSQVSAGASAQVGTGLVMEAPLKVAGLVPKLTNDLAGVGFVWSQPSVSTNTVYHRNEYVFDTFYTLQLSPTLRFQTDFQLVWNPVFNPEPGPFQVIQTQILLSW